MFSQRPYRKLDVKQEGPFKIVQLVGSMAAKIDIPADWGHHPVFYTNLLRLAPND